LKISVHNGERLSLEQIRAFLEASEEIGFELRQCLHAHRVQAEDRRQLDIYLNMVPSVQIGVWYNGEQHLFLRKVRDKKTAWAWEELPDIPQKDQRIEDIGLYRRSSLIAAPPTLIAAARKVY
jgi:hypothetical protein